MGGALKHRRKRARRNVRCTICTPGRTGNSFVWAGRGNFGMVRDNMTKAARRRAAKQEE